MSFQIVSSKVTGKPDRGGWSQVYDFKPAGEVKLKKLGHFFALISTHASRDQPGGMDSGGHGDIDNVIVGREILARLHEEYFGKYPDNFSASLDSDVKPLLLIKNAVGSVMSEFSEMEGVEIAA